MTCNSCGEEPKKVCNKFPSAVVEIDNPERIILLRKVVIPASMGDETDVPASIGKYRNVILHYEINNHTYLYSSDGIPTALDMQIPQEVLDRISFLEDEDVRLQNEIDELKNSPDVVDIVATYEDLMDYDTSSLGDKDVIRVLADETHDDESSYYRWDKTNSQWVFIGAVEGYYTKDQTDDLLDEKQDKLTAGSNISIDADNVISATDTTYSNFVGTDGTAAGTAGLVPAPATTDAGKFLKADGTWDTAGGNINTIAKELTTDDYNWNSTAGSSTTEPFDCVAMWLLPAGVYKLGTGVLGKIRSGQTASNLVYIFTIGKTTSGGYSSYIPVSMFYIDGTGKATLEMGSMRTDGSAYTKTATISGVVQTTGSSTTDIMSQNAITNILYGETVKLGLNSNTSSSQSVAIGRSADARASHDVVIGYSAASKSMGGTSSTGQNVAIGKNATTGNNLTTYYSNGTAVGANSAAKSSNATAIGCSASANGSSVAIGHNATTSASYAIALGNYANATTQGQMDISTGTQTTAGYGSSNYRLLTGLYDPQSAHDAATKGYVDTAVAGAGATITMTTTDPGEGAALAANNFVAVYDETPLNLDYSTSEVDTGTVWIDGSAIYKKTINLGTLPNNTTNTIAHNITNLGVVVKQEGYAFRSNDSTSIVLPFVSASVTVQVDVKGADVRVISSADMSGFKEAYTTLYYTKSS